MSDIKLNRGRTAVSALSRLPLTAAVSAESGKPGPPFYYKWVPTRTQMGPSRMRNLHNQAIQIARRRLAAAGDPQTGAVRAIVLGLIELGMGAGYDGD